MTSRHIGNLIVVALLVATGVWVAFHTHWEDEILRTPLQGEALSNRHYTLEHIAKSAGIATQRITSLRTLPPTRDVLLVDSFTDEFGHRRTEDIKHWVERGGRLVVSEYLFDSLPHANTWAGLRERLDGDPPPPARKDRLSFPRQDESDCHPVELAANAIASGDTLTLCQPLSDGYFPVKTPLWSASNAHLIHMLRMPVGKGSVIIVPPHTLLDNMDILRHDNALLFFSATGIKTGERLDILDFPNVESFPLLLWRLAAPALVFLGLAFALLIARQMPRFGPLAPAPLAMRRSLAEQIRANAAFSARTGNLSALRTAVRRALDETAAARITGFEALDLKARIHALATQAGLDPKTLHAAMTEDAVADMAVQRSAIALLEYTRRILDAQAPHRRTS